MALDSSVKVRANSHPGAPTLSGTAGSMIAVLDAVLVNGFNLLGADSVVVSGGVATVTRAAGGFWSHMGTQGAYEGLVVLIAGATPTALNGEKRILRVALTSSTTFTFDATGVADGAATGTITFKYAPLGWSKLYTGTNTAIYQRMDLNATGSVLVVYDTYGKYALMRMAEVSNPALLATGGGWSNSADSVWTKSNVADGSARAWTIIGDGRGFFMARGWHANDQQGMEHTYWGDIAPAKANDPYCCVTFGANQDCSGVAGGPGYFPSSLMDESTAGSVATVFPGDYRGSWYIQRSYSGMGSPAPVKRNAVAIAPAGSTSSGYLVWGISGWGASLSGAGPSDAQLFATSIPFPNPADNGIFGVPVIVWEFQSPAIRGTLPGLFYLPMTTLYTNFVNYASTSGTGVLSGRVILQVTSKVNANASRATNSNGGVLYDITGPWAR